MGFPQLPFQFAYDSLLDRMCRSHERDSELRAMLRGCSHYSFTRKDLEEREQAREEQIEELNSQIEDLSVLRHYLTCDEKSMQCRRTRC